MLGEPTYRKVLHGDDVGTRLSHMMDLQMLLVGCLRHSDAP